MAYWVYCRQGGLDAGAFAHVCAELDESQHWPADRLLTQQRLALRATLEYAVRHVPHYRELFARLGLQPADADAPETLSRLPVLRRPTLLEFPDRLISDDHVAGVRYFSSSGTSGRPVRTAKDVAARCSTRAVRARAMSWYAATPWDRQGMLVSQHLSRSRRIATALFDRLAGCRRNGTPALDAPEAAAAARRFARFRPALILGQPSFIHRLVRAAADLGLDPRTWSTRLVLANSEVLTPYVDRTIAEAFGCPVLNEYGCTEVGSMAHRCPAGMLHLNPEHVLVELLDDDARPVPPGVPGEVVLTSLHNRAMPLIRYAVGDIAVWADAPCPCGRQPGLIGLSHVKGRTFFAWRTPAGRYLAPIDWLAPVQTLLASAGHWECQLVQHTPHEIEVRVHPCPPVPSQATLDAIADLLRPALGNEVQVTYRSTPIQRNTGGKLAVICRPRPTP